MEVILVLSIKERVFTLLREICPIGFVYFPISLKLGRW